MKTTRISGPSGCGKSIAMSAICNELERQGRAVLTALPGSTTDDVLAMCTSPVPFAIFIPDYQPDLIDLDELNAQPGLRNVWCYVEVEEDFDDDLDDVLPLPVTGRAATNLAASSAGIVTAHDDSEGGHHD